MSSIQSVGDAEESEEQILRRSYVGLRGEYEVCALVIYHSVYLFFFNLPFIKGPWIYNSISLKFQCISIGHTL